jgi:hypothetical protein
MKTSNMMRVPLLSERKRFQDVLWRERGGKLVGLFLQNLVKLRGDRVMGDGGDSEKLKLVVALVLAS